MSVRVLQKNRTDRMLTDTLEQRERLQVCRVSFRNRRSCRGREGPQWVGLVASVMRPNKL